MSAGSAGLKRGWLSGILWSSEPASAGVASRAILTAVYRAAYVQQRGSAHTLREILAQEGYAMAAARCTDPTLDADDMAYTREVMAPSIGRRGPTDPDSMLVWRHSRPFSGLSTSGFE